MCEWSFGNQTGVGQVNLAESEVFNHYAVMVEYLIFDNHSFVIILGALVYQPGGNSRPNPHH